MAKDSFCEGLLCEAVAFLRAQVGGNPPPVCDLGSERAVSAPLSPTTMQCRQLLPQNKSEVRGALGGTALHTALSFLLGFSGLPFEPRPVAWKGQGDASAPFLESPPTLCLWLPGTSFGLNLPPTSVVPEFHDANHSGHLRKEYVTWNSLFSPLTHHSFWFVSVNEGPQVCPAAGKKAHVPL